MIAQELTTTQTYHKQQIQKAIQEAQGNSFSFDEKSLFESLLATRDNGDVGKATASPIHSIKNKIC